MSSLNIGIRIQPEIVSAFLRHSTREKLASFARVALIEKINRDFGENISTRLGDLKPGERVDLANASAGTLEKMRQQAAVARAGKKRKAQKCDDTPSPRRRESGSGVSNIPNPEGRGVSDLRKLPSVPESVRRPSKHKKTQSNEN